MPLKDEDSEVVREYITTALDCLEAQAPWRTSAGLRGPAVARSFAAMPGTQRFLETLRRQA